MTQKRVAAAAYESDLAGWGRFPVIRGRERLSEDLEQITEGAVLSRGLGRSYGDASLPPPTGGIVAGTRLADRLLGFCAETGVLRVEAGCPLEQLNRIFWPRGFCSPVTPGTRFVTVGGMVASDVHGKNHHDAGCFGEHVRALRMRLADGRIAEVTERAEPELFRATLGGMGLTGHILEVEFTLHRISSPWILQESRRACDLEDLILRLQDESRHWPYTVCWLDAAAPERSLGRGIVVAGRWAEPEEARHAKASTLPSLAIPFPTPGPLLNHLVMRGFNEAVWLAHGSGVHRAVVDPNSFFYPLDVIRHWNRLYGAAGFIQYQCVVPLETASGALASLLRTLRSVRTISPIVVVKDCAGEGKGMLSFPRTGISIALDAPVRGGRIVELVRRWNEITHAAGGRIYLTKDAVTERAALTAMEPRLPAFQKVRDRFDPERRIRSALSARLLGDDA